MQFSVSARRQIDNSAHRLSSAIFQGISALKSCVHRNGRVLQTGDRATGFGGVRNIRKYGLVCARNSGRDIKVLME